MTETVLKQIAALQEMTNPELRDMWEDLFNTTPSNRTNKDFMIRRLAWRIQELAFGGLLPETKQKINRLKGRSKTYKKMIKTLPPIGTELIREFQGTDHRVMVLADGFEYDGVMYDSLSQVARKITGTRWSGPRFFGLKS